MGITALWCDTPVVHPPPSRQTGHKKKLNTFISFPEQLDMGPFLEGKQGIIPRNKLVSRKVFTPKSVDLFFLEDTDVKAFGLCVSVLIWFSRSALCVRAECSADSSGHQRVFWPLHRSREGCSHRRLVQIQRWGNREDGRQETSAWPWGRYR